MYKLDKAYRKANKVFEEVHQQIKPMLSLRHSKNLLAWDASRDSVTAASPPSLPDHHYLRPDPESQIQA